MGKMMNRTVWQANTKRKVISGIGQVLAWVAFFACHPGKEYPKGIEHMGLCFTGWLKIDSDADYTFKAWSDYITEPWEHPTNFFPGIFCSEQNLDYWVNRNRLRV